MLLGLLSSWSRSVYLANLISDISAAFSRSPFTPATAALFEITMGLKVLHRLRSWRWRWLRMNFPRRSTTSSWDAGEIEGGSWLKCLCFCTSSCFRATKEDEEQAQSKKGLKKQQKEAEKAAKKAEKQAKLVSVVLFFLVCCFTSVAPPSYSWLGCDVCVCRALWV